MTPTPQLLKNLQGLIKDDLLVWGRCRIWHIGLKDMAPLEPYWSKWAWWKAMWYPHRGPPSEQGSWGIYGGHEGFTGPGDAEITHYLSMPAPPADAPRN